MPKKSSGKSSSSSGRSKDGGSSSQRSGNQGQPYAGPSTGPYRGQVNLPPMREVFRNLDAGLRWQQGTQPNLLQQVQVAEGTEERSYDPANADGQPQYYQAQQGPKVPGEQHEQYGYVQESPEELYDVRESPAEFDPRFPPPPPAEDPEQAQLWSAAQTRGVNPTIAQAPAGYNKPAVQKMLAVQARQNLDIAPAPAAQHMLPCACCRVNPRTLPRG